ncbi:Ciliogenesis-associated TTC17-interacting protein isoform 5 [Schistosoma japonicum]|nr:Ciliogenesis-associated TTC17-interacting protein [Schistosoma japonicum]TNN16472.1 Ciliogenesis-associated TTC17-interacting protein isoform 5 [Schistosoma japonicum]
MFDDVLICYSNNNKPVGSYECRVRDDEPDVQGLFVRTSIRSLLGEIHNTTKLEAYLTLSLETISQIKVETILMNGDVMEKKCSIHLIENMYEINSSESVNGIIKSSVKKQLPKLGSFGLITESSDLIFQRLLAKFPPMVPIEVIGLDLDCNLTTVSYINLGERNVFVGDNEIPVLGIQRTVHSQRSLPLSWQTYFMEDGHMVLRIQVGSPITIKVNTIPERFRKERYLPRPVIPNVVLNWEDDLELYSRFLDRKDEIKAQYLLYLRDHPEIYDMISDFIKSLLLRKPDEVVKYASEYFKSFSARALPGKIFPMKIV